MRVQIKSKGQFYGCIGTVAKILNQHQIVVKIDGLQGYYTFGHRSVRLIDADLSIQNKVAIGIKQKIEAKLKECEINPNNLQSIAVAKFCRELLNGKA
jgi:hypothetical protein